MLRTYSPTTLYTSVISMVTGRNNLTSQEILLYTYTSLNQKFQNFKTQYLDFVFQMKHPLNTEEKVVPAWPSVIFHSVKRIIYKWEKWCFALFMEFANAGCEYSNSVVSSRRGLIRSFICQTAMEKNEFKQHGEWGSENNWLYNFCWDILWIFNFCHEIQCLNFITIYIYHSKHIFKNYIYT